MKSIGSVSFKLFFRILFSTLLITNIIVISSLVFFLVNKRITYLYASIGIMSVIFIFLLIMLLVHRKYIREIENIFKTFKIIGNNEKTFLLFLERLEKLYKDVKNRELKELFETLDNLKQSLTNLLNFEKMNNIDLLENIEKIDENLNMYVLESLSLVETIIETNNQLMKELMEENKKILYNVICPIYFSMDIARDWKERVERIFDITLKNSLDKIQIVKSINEIDFAMINETISNFIEQQKKSELFLIQEKEGLDSFFSKIENIKSSFFEYMEKYYGEFKRISGVVKNIEEISGSIKIISLNMGIEASKTQGNKAFNVISRELQKLSLNADKLVKQILDEIKILLTDVEREKELLVSELKNLSELMNKSKAITMEYDENVKKINSVLESLIEDIKISNEKNKSLILDLFKSFQDIIIAKEELDHKDSFIARRIEKIVESIENLVKEKNVCGEDEHIKQKKIEIFNEIKSLITTGKEREFFEEIYKKFINEEYITENLKDKDLTGLDKDVILF